jgi:hypothetical protein
MVQGGGHNDHEIGATTDVIVKTDFLIFLR